MNTRNYAQKSNFLCGSDKLPLVPFYAQTINIPGITMSQPTVGGRAGFKTNLSADSVEFGSLTMEVLIDEDYRIYQEINDIVFNHINLETGSYKEFYFDFWLQVVDDMGKFVLKVDYFNCSITSIGDINFDTSDETTESVFSIDMKYDYHKVSFKSPDVPLLVI